MLERFNSFCIEPEVLSNDGSYATVVFAPLERGFGNTIGNTLRRLLLSSIPSASVFAIRIASLPHEFSPIKGVAEDAIQLIIAIKKLVLKIDEKIVDFEKLKEEPIEKWPYLKVRREKVGVIYAGDIECFPGVEIVNPDLKLCEITEETNFELDLYCMIDRGYRSSSENRELLNTLSLIPIDSVFSPILMVDWKVSEEKTTKYGLNDKLTLSVTTNGSIKALEAIWYASKILLSIFEKIASQKVKFFKLDMCEHGTTGDKDESKSTPSDMDKMKSISSSPIENLKLGQRTYNILKNAGINTISEVISLGVSGLSELKNLGKKALVEIQDKLRENGYELKGDTPS